MIAAVEIACGSARTEALPVDTAPDDSAMLADAELTEPIVDSGDPGDGADTSSVVTLDGNAETPSLFVTGVESFTQGECAGFGAASMPSVVEGPPVGGGAMQGSTDVVSLGGGGSIVLSFEPSAIVDGPGPDFIIFENPFLIGGNPNDIYAEPGEVSVSDDGVTWKTFPCAPTISPSAPTGVSGPYGSCAGWHPVYSNPSNAISPFDASKAGGDPFDLADLGVARARYVRIVDKTDESCPDSAERPTTNGFDLDAISILNLAQP
jgi:hypothetical protein